MKEKYNLIFKKNELKYTQNDKKMNSIMKTYYPDTETLF